MPAFDIRASLGLRTWEPKTEIGSFAQPRRWPRRHWLASSAMAVSLVAILAASVLAIWQPWQKCGRGMTAMGSPYRCIGLNLDSTPFQARDPLAKLEKRIADYNATIKEPYATVVLLENMTLDTAVDSTDLNELQYDIEGAFTAVRRANTELALGSTSFKIKLLLANPGSSITARYWRQAVEAIKRSVPAEHIVAVTGIGVSMDQTRDAVTALGADRDQSIATVGSLVTANNMNEDLEGNQLRNFFRVAPTNTDEVHAAAQYILQHLSHRKIMLIKDANQADSYAKTLADSFNELGVTREFSEIKVSYTKSYTSPSGSLNDATREGTIAELFRKWIDSICDTKPDLIYFAGRGVDLTTFLKVMTEGQCANKTPATVVTGDDANNLVGKPVPYSNFVQKIVYTGLAAGGQWKGKTQYQTLAPDSYRIFENAFTQNGFAPDDLDDGNAIMNYDATLTAIMAARMSDSTRTNPSLVAGNLRSLNCDNGHPVAGASGDIALGEDGNPTNKPIPILQLKREGTQSPEEIVWPDGKPAC